MIPVKMKMFGNIFKLTLFSASERSTNRPCKVHKSVMPPEYNLARLVANVSNPDPSWIVERTAMHWIGISVNSNRDVFEILWHEMGLQGRLNFLFIPSTVEKCFVHKNNLSGRVELGRMDMLNDLRVGWNQLSGSFPLNDLPAVLTRLWGHSNHFTGGLDVTALPSQIQILYLYENAFSGPVCFTSLPASIVALALDCNRLEGSVEVSHLPPSLKSLSLYNNSFTGSLDFSRLSRSLNGLALADNKFVGEIDISILPDSMKFVSFFKNDLTAYIDMHRKPHKLSALCVSNPPRMKTDLSAIPTRFAKYDATSGDWFAYNGSVPESLQKSIETMEEAKQLVDSTWWNALDQDGWHFISLGKYEG